MQTLFSEIKARMRIFVLRIQNIAFVFIHHKIGFSLTVISKITELKMIKLRIVTVAQVNSLHIILLKLELPVNHLSILCTL